MQRASFVFAFILALAACEGPMGPVGPPGPGTRLVLNGVIDQFGEGFVDLPAEAGTVTSPPAVSCYLSEAGDFWFIIALDSDGTNLLTACVLGQDPANLFVGIVGAPVDWLFRVVVIY